MKRDSPSENLFFLLNIFTHVFAVVQYFGNGMEPSLKNGQTLILKRTENVKEGDIVPGEITFFRLQSTADNHLYAYVAEGEVLPVATRSFGGIGIFAIKEMGRFYRHVLIQKRYPHHGAVAFAHCGKALFEVFKYLGDDTKLYDTIWTEIISEF